MKYLSLLVLAALPLAAQQQRQLMPLVKDYLELTSVQTIAIASANDEYNRAVNERSIRMRQVMTEIAQETVKDNLDPQAIGVRYQEIELICRDLAGLAAMLRQQNLAILDDKQRAKLKTLEDAFKLASIINEAQAAGLMSAPMNPPAMLMGLTSGPATLPPTQFPTGVVSMCTTPYQFGLFRPGDAQPAQ